MLNIFSVTSLVMDQEHQELIIQENLERVTEMLEMFETIPERLEDLQEVLHEEDENEEPADLVAGSMELFEELGQLDSIDSIKAILQQLQIKLYDYSEHLGLELDWDAYEIE